METVALYAVVAMALVFDFVNGFHDAANSIATVVATRVLKPWQAVLWAAFWNFVAFLVLPLTVANEIAKIVDPSVVSPGLIFAGLVGAIFWNVLTAYLGLPSSSSHALIGGVVGAGIAKAGTSVIDGDELRKTATFIFYSPLIGLALGFTLIIVGDVDRPPDPLPAAGQPGVPRVAARVGGGIQPRTRRERRAEDDGDHRRAADRRRPPVAQRAQRSRRHPAVGRAVVLRPPSRLGTMLGGWRIVRTMGTKLTRLQPMGGVCAESAAAATSVLRHAPGHPGEHDPHHHRLDRRHRVVGAAVGGSLERRRAASCGRGC